MQFKPSLDEVRALRDQGNLCPIYAEILADLETPVSAFLKVARGPWRFLLESVEGGQHLARYSFIGAEPYLTLRFENGLAHAVQGGTLFQDIQRDLPEARNHEQAHDRTQPSHPVEVREGTVLAELVGRGQLMVNSTHHQAVSRLGEGLVASAVAPDGVVEAIESSNGAFAVGVQWHPELLLQSMPLQLGVYRGLVTRARDARR